MSLDAAVSVEDAYRAHGARLWPSILLFGGDPDVAEHPAVRGDPDVASDAVAEAFAQLIRRGPLVDDAAAWVTRAAFRIAAGELKERRQTGYAIVDEPYQMPEPAWRLA